MSEYVRHVKQLDKNLTSNLKFFDIELTERCNNCCIHCYINQPEDDQQIKALEMDTAFIKDILKQSAALGCLTVRFTGGEPLLREDFTELYLFARRLGLKVLVFTNARLITKELAELFVHITPGEPIEVSVYGMHAGSYEAVSGVRGSFREFRHGVSLLQKYNIPFVVKQSLLPQNRAEIPEFEAFAANLLYMESIPGYVMNYDLRARRDDEAKNLAISRLRISSEETLAFLTREPEKYVKGMREFAGKFMGPSGDRLFSCGAGHSICIDAYGKVQMCMLLRHPDTIYHLDQAQQQERHPESKLLPLEYALTEFFPTARELRAQNPDYLSRCAVCFLKGLCEQCPAKSWEEHGTLDTPVEYLCRVAHAQAEYLGLLLEGENSWKLAPALWKTRLENFIKVENK